MHQDPEQPTSVETLAGDLAGYVLEQWGRFYHIREAGDPVVFTTIEVWEDERPTDAELLAARQRWEAPLDPTTTWDGLSYARHIEGN